MMRVGRSFHIDSSHVLPGHPKCGVMHGHTYRFDVVLEGEPGVDGMLMDFGEMRDRVDAFLDRLDHAHLNDILPNPTVEHIARFVFEGLRETVPQVALVRVYEGDAKWAEYTP